jgi:hypothetical protein
MYHNVVCQCRNVTVAIYLPISSSFEAVSERLHRPLDWKQFDIMKEWYLEVPLEFQILLSKQTPRKQNENLQLALQYSVAVKFHCISY